MENITLFFTLMVLGLVLEFLLIRFVRRGFFMVLILLVLIGLILKINVPFHQFLKLVLYGLLPLLFMAILLFVFVAKEEPKTNINEKYRVILDTKWYRLKLDNIRRGISIIGSAGSGKTESVVYNLFDHLGTFGFCGVMHDYKNFEITEMAYPIFKQTDREFYIISFDPMYHRVNPIAPHYIPDEESVHEISRVLLENLLELKESGVVEHQNFSMML